MCPRKPATSTQELRFTLGDYERRELVKPISQILEQTNQTILHTRYLAYGTIAVGSVTALAAAWFIGKGIAGVWDDAKDVVGNLKDWGIPLGPLGEWTGNPKWTPFNTED